MNLFSEKGCYWKQKNQNTYSGPALLVPDTKIKTLNYGPRVSNGFGY